MLQNEIRWLHLSDVHAGKTPDHQEKMFAKIVARVAEKVRDKFVPDLLFFSGDIAFSGLEQDYDFFNQTLLVPLQEVIGADIAGRIFIAPGNHDVVRGVHQAFDRKELSNPESGFFELGAKGRLVRQILLPRFEPFRDFVRPINGDWINTTGGCAFRQIDIPRSNTCVGVALINTSWFSRGDDDRYNLVASSNMAEEALLQMPHAKLRFVLGHHPLEWLDVDDARMLRSIFAKHHVIYLHGHLHEEQVSQPPLDKQAWPVCVQGLAAYQASDRRTNLNGIIWGAASVDQGFMVLQPDRWNGTDWHNDTINYPDENKIPLNGGTWWQWTLPEGPQLVINNLLKVELWTTRFTRRTKNSRIVGEHDRRDENEDTGEAELLRSRMSVDEALSFFNGVLLLSESGGGKSFAFEQMYRTLCGALTTNDTRMIHAAYPNWRHAPLPMPIRIDAKHFAEWLDGQTTSTGTTLGLLDYAYRQTLPDEGSKQSDECCPAEDRISLEAHCRRDSFVLMVDDWESLSLSEAKRVWTEISTTLNVTAGSAHRPAVFFASTLDSGPFRVPGEQSDGQLEPSDLRLERITIAKLTPEAREKLIEQYCRFSGQRAEDFRRAYQIALRIANTPRWIKALLEEWSFEGHSTSPQASWTMKDMYLLHIRQCLRGIIDEKDLEILRPFTVRLLEQYLETPGDSLLRFDAFNGAKSLAEKLCAGGLLKHHPDGLYSIRQSTLQDYLIAWELQKATVKDILQRLKKKKHPRREPIKYTLIWISAYSNSSDKVIATLARLVGKKGDYFAHTTMAAADFLAEAGDLLAETGDLLSLTDHFAVDHINDARDSFVHLLLKNGNLSSVDRYFLGRALAFVGDHRPGVGRDELGIMPRLNWIEVPVGKAELGQTDADRALYGKTRVAPDDERPHPVSFEDRFFLSEFPVTNEQFHAFVEDEVQGYKADVCWAGLKRPDMKWQSVGGIENHPAVNVSWDEAKAFCRWYSKMAGFEVDLPTSIQWEYAARGQKDEQLFAFGSPNTLVGRMNSQEEGLPGTTAVGMFPQSQSPFGVQDMCGNVFEWCADAHHPQRPNVMITKGGSYNHDVLRCRIALRGKKNRDSQHPYLGFRVCSPATSATSAPKRVLLIGGGFAGTCTAVRLLAQARAPLDIMMVETTREQAFGGLAYSETTAYWEHLFNLQAGRVSLYREDRLDFVNWLNDDSTDRSDWNMHFKTTKFRAFSAVPRRLYQRYLKDRIQRAAAGASSNVRFQLVEGRVIAVDEIEHKATLLLSNGTKVALSSDQVLLCTGNIRIKRHPVLDECRDYPAYLENQYSRRARIALRNLPMMGGRVLVIGSALRAYDVVMTLCSKKFSELAKDNVKITLLSRNKNRHSAYTPEHVHRVANIDEPEFLKNLSSGQKFSSPQVIDLVTKAYFEALDSPDLKAEPKTIRSERILKAWEQYVPKLISHLHPEDVPALYMDHKSLITALRIGVVPEIANIVEEAGRSGQCKFAVGEVTEIKPHGRKGLKVTIDGHPEPEIFDLVVNCIGREQDYAKISDDLWKGLIESGRAQRPQISQIGVEVDDQGMLVNKGKTISNWLGAVGVMREGSEFQNVGRLGSFSFTLGPLKNQALQAAVHLLRRLDGAYLSPGWTKEARTFARSFSRVREAEWLQNVMTRCVERACEDLHLSHVASEICGQLTSKLSSIMQLLHCLEGRLRSRSIAAGEDLQVKITALQKSLRESLDGSHPESVDVLTNFVQRFSLYLEEIALAQLTRLDEVEPSSF